MFEILSDQMKHDEQAETSARERILRRVATGVLSAVIFGALYLSIHLLP
jgi:hypothetical protein